MPSGGIKMKHDLKWVTINTENTRLMGWMQTQI